MKLYERIFARLSSAMHCTGNVLACWRTENWMKFDQSGSDWDEMNETRWKNICSATVMMHWYILVCFLTCLSGRCRLQSPQRAPQPGCWKKEDHQRMMSTSFSFLSRSTTISSSSSTMSTSFSFSSMSTTMSSMSSSSSTMPTSFSLPSSPHVPTWIIMSQDGNRVERLKAQFNESFWHGKHLEEEEDNETEKVRIWQCLCRWTRDVGTLRHMIIW